jgi:hypothetical protein
MENKSRSTPKQPVPSPNPTESTGIAQKTHISSKQDIDTLFVQHALKLNPMLKETYFKVLSKTLLEKKAFDVQVEGNRIIIL